MRSIGANSARCAERARARAARRAPRRGRRRTGIPTGGPGIGRDSSLVRSMPRSANTLSALNSEPGSLGSEKTIDVLSATRVAAAARRPIDEEARDVVVEVLDRRRRATIRPNTSPARADAIARGVGQPRVGDHLGAAGGVVGGDDLDAGQRAQEPLALREPLRVRVDAPQAVERRAGQRQQVVHDRQLDLADDRQLVRRRSRS